MYNRYFGYSTFALYTFSIGTLHVKEFWWPPRYVMGSSRHWMAQRLIKILLLSSILTMPLSHQIHNWLNEAFAADQTLDSTISGESRWWLTLLWTTTKLNTELICFPDGCMAISTFKIHVIMWRGGMETLLHIVSVAKPDPLCQC